MMKKVSKIEFHIGSKEELLPDFMSDFPYIASQSDLSRYPECLVPWHWHKAVELFYLESGTLEYYTPNAKHTFTEGCGGMINSNVLHMTPNDYIRNYRLQTACQLLARTNRSITDISHSCGLGSSSYFGKVFRDSMDCSPTEYREKWQDFDTNRQK